MRKLIQVISLLLFLALISISCVVPAHTTVSSPEPPIETAYLPTPASTLPELVENMSSDDMAVRRVSIYALDEYGDDAVSAIPALRNNLHVDDFQVQTAAIIALKHLGPKASSAIPDLIDLLHSDKNINVSVYAADALGFVGDRTVIPELAVGLFSENPYQSDDVAISCAKSIARITGEQFTDYDSNGAYTLSENGVPYIVLDAREWWLETGQYEDWSIK
jgi:hypothetical protein